jgi:type I site-specific restriction endonuclease
LNFPANLIAVEKSLTLNSLSKRADIVVFDRKLEPWMLVECKKVEVKLDQSVFDQAARYNLVMKVPFLLITNGMQLLAAEIKNGQVEFIQDLPGFPML